MRKDKGYSLVIVLLIISCLSVASVYTYKQSKRKQVNDFAYRTVDSITFMINAIQKYQEHQDKMDVNYYQSVDQEFPSSVDDLKVRGLLHACTQTGVSCSNLLRSPFNGEVKLINQNAHDKKMELLYQIRNYQLLLNELRLSSDQVMSLLSIKNQRHVDYDLKILWRKLRVAKGLIPRTSIVSIKGQWWFKVDVYAAAGMTNNDAEKAGVVATDGSVPLLKDWNVGGNHKLNVQEGGIILADGGVLSSNSIAIKSGIAQVNSSPDDVGIYVDTGHCKKVSNDGYYGISENDINVLAFIKGIYPIKNANVVNYDIGTFGITYKFKDNFLSFDLVNFASGSHGISGQFGGVSQANDVNNIPISGQVSYIITCKQTK